MVTTFCYLLYNSAPPLTSSVSDFPEFPLLCLNAYCNFISNGIIVCCAEVEILM